MKRTYEHVDSCGCGFIAQVRDVHSHALVRDAIQALVRMAHRGGVSEDGKSGDGCGVMFSFPKDFFAKCVSEKTSGYNGKYAVGMLFLQDLSAKDTFEKICRENHLKVLFFRDVPTDESVLGREAKSRLPHIIQAFVAPSDAEDEKRFKELLYIVQQQACNAKQGIYVCSLSDETIVYKGLFKPKDLTGFYLDLKDELFQARFAIFHQRFSTNTLPNWSLAQPFRTLAHNGEINSINGNVNNFDILSETFDSPYYSKDEMGKINPIFDYAGSDSANLDNVFQFLYVNRGNFIKTVKSLIPIPWQNSSYVDPETRGFYEFMSCNFEPWDGPANISLTNGSHIGCFLDRNGLRPAKYIITKDERLIVGSEYGIVDVEDSNIKTQGRLESGDGIVVDLKEEKVLLGEDIENILKHSDELGEGTTYLEFLNNRNLYLSDDSKIEFKDLSLYTLDDIITYQRYHDITNEVEEFIFDSYLKEGKEPTSSMGDDTPTACFSQVSRPFSDYFKQKFAQVTNPAIDHIREKNVMSTSVIFGPKNNILKPHPDHCKRLKTISPFLTKEKIDVLRKYGKPNSESFIEDYKMAHFYTGFTGNLEQSLEKLAEEVYQSVVQDQSKIIILDDRVLDANTMIMPMPMVLGYVSNYLKERKKRSQISIISYTGEVYDAHSLAVQIAYGATAVYPYLLLATTLKLSDRHPDAPKELLKKTKKAMNLGILKILSKMGISTVNSYYNSGLFDIIGLSEDIAEKCFPTSKVLIPGLSFADIEEKIKEKHRVAYSKPAVTQPIYPLEVGSLFKFMPNGEYHDFAPEIASQLNTLALTKDKEKYQELKNQINNRGLRMVRDFFDIKSDKSPISIDKVESATSITKRFCSAAMSLGSISPVAHEVIAEAMNTIGGMSNSGEGGEDRNRFGTIKNSKIKQIASGRFGVTPEYLRSASELQIKVAQGAKPGEGGQLPGHKVSPLIASLRYTMPGVTLISPPPHHDIYSIEDLAQLIYDLKQVNPEAEVSVKLVSSSGVGTIAVGVAKAYADKVIISGCDGGTGAAQLSSIKHAGNPWEMGLVEAHNQLKTNKLRYKVELQADGGLKTGLDVIKAALLGAESYGFGTAILSSVGCKILRICHLNRCSVGIATQNRHLIDHFKGSVEGVILYLTSIAEEVREILAEMGYSSLNEVIGRNYLLQQKEDAFAQRFNFSNLTRYVEDSSNIKTEKNELLNNNSFEKNIFEKIKPVIEGKEKRVIINDTIHNYNRSFGAYTSGEIASACGAKGLTKGSVIVNLDGYAGQSFGAFLNKGLHLVLKGAANDYVGKGMHGGSITISASEDGRNLAGNTCLYGATGGKLYVRGTVGERFAVRNSGALAVVEGTGHHPCEYMTGGTVVVLGETGKNFGAGMTGGCAFVYDVNKTFRDKMNEGLIEAKRIIADGMDEEKHYLKTILASHHKKTGSSIAKKILDDFKYEISYFWLVTAKDMNYPIHPFDGN